MNTNLIKNMILIVCTSLGSLTLFCSEQHKTQTLQASIVLTDDESTLLAADTRDSYQLLAARFEAFIRKATDTLGLTQECVAIEKARASLLEQQLAELRVTARSAPAQLKKPDSDDGFEAINAEEHKKITDQLGKVSEQLKQTSAVQQAVQKNLLQSQAELESAQKKQERMQAELEAERAANENLRKQLERAKKELEDEQSKARKKIEKMRTKRAAIEKERDTALAESVEAKTQRNEFEMSLSAAYLKDNK